MNKIKIITALTLMFPTYGFASETSGTVIDTENLDFPKIIGLAIKNSDAIKMSEKQVEKSFIDVKMKQSEFLPTVTLQGNAGKTKIDKKTITSNSVDLSVNQNLFNGLKTANGINLAKTAKEKSILNHKKNVSNFILQIGKVYYTVKKIRVLKQSYEVAMKNSQKIMDIENIKFKNGASTKTKYLQAESSFYSNKAKLVDMETSLNSAKINFKNITGVDIPKVLPSIDLSGIELPSDMDSLIQKAKKDNMDVKIAGLDKKIADYNYKISLASHSPELNAIGSVKRDITNSMNTVYMGVNYKVPIFSGGRDIGGVAKSKADKMNSSYAYNQALQMAEINAMNAWKKYLSSQQELKSYKKSFESRKLILDAQNIKYKNGLTTSSDLLDAQDKKIQMEQMYISAQEKHALSILELLIVINELTPENLKKIK
ncbi:MAG: TolC family protein [Alphaproteobacteria bacterium]